MGVPHIGPTGESESWWMRAREMLGAIDTLYARGVTIYRVPDVQSGKGAS
jgi:hypothetical protein